jgi:hypothetical protein
MQVSQDVDPKLVTEITEAVTTASHIIVNSKETHEAASNAVLSLDGYIKKVKEYWQEPKEIAFKMHKGIVAKEAEMLNPMVEQRKAIVSRISAYLTEEDRKRQEEFKRLQAEQRAKEEAERNRLLEEAAKAETAGKSVDAEVLLTMAEEVQVETPPPPVQVIPQTTHTVNGTVSQRKDIEVTITDPKTLLKAIVDGNLPIGWVEISASKIKSYVKNTGEMTIPGCQIKEVVSATFRGGR